MKVLNEHTKFAHLGKPGSVFSKGFRRRLNIITKLWELNNKKILDLGCGEGVWLKEFSNFTPVENIFGSEYDLEQVIKLKDDPPTSLKNESLKIPIENIRHCAGEDLKFEDNFFDIVFQNEVLEHVQDDQKTLDECLRVLKKDGILIFFTPNRLWPFEQHGIFIGKKYIWGNIPLLPWMPKFIRKKLAPHVRNYSNSDIKKLIKNTSYKNYSFKILHHKHVFPGFSGLTTKFGFIGKIIQSFFFKLENTWFEKFGISHLVIAQKNEKN